MFSTDHGNFRICLTKETKRTKSNSGSNVASFVPEQDTLLILETSHLISRVAPATPLHRAYLKLSWE